jgi:predicted ATPase/DNA-binding winged helix-turn-helix (wHTH) protein
MRYGRFEIHPAERALIVDGRPVAPGARAFDLLLALVERCDRVVSKNELLDVVWAGRVVEENNLAVHVAALRKLLGAQTIATIPGRGYRFVAPSSDPTACEPPPAARPEGPVPARPPLPPLPASLVGRADDLAALESLWQRSRCITLVGPGGIGKTTLACVAAHVHRPALRDGAAWVDLAEVCDPALVSDAVRQTLGVEALGTPDTMPALVEALKPLQLLLVLDNAEHLLETVARLVRAVLAAAPGVVLLVTSQAPLKIEGEQVFRLGPLAIPDDGVDAGRALAHGAVALFAAHARAGDRRFAVDDGNVGSVVALCRHLDGVPLALKLAAARLPLLGLPGLLARIENRLRLFRHADRDAPARQQTLLAALDWSHGLLSAPMQVVFRRLAVFSGGFALELAGEVASDATVDPDEVIEALAELVDRSLVDVVAGDPPRYRLPETAREYARLRLEAAGEVAAMQQRHAHAMARWMDDAYDRYWSMPDRPWLNRQVPELDNVRAALEWAKRAEPEVGVRIIGSAGVMFMLRGQAAEARRHFAAFDAGAHEAGVSPAAARYWLERSRLHWSVESESMRDFATRAVHLYRALGDRRGLALALRCMLGSEVGPEGEADAALAELVSLVPPDAPPRLRAQRLLAEVNVHRIRGRKAQACAAWEAMLALATQAGLDGMAIAALDGLAGARLACGDVDEALDCARRLIADPRARHGNFLLRSLGTMAQAHLLRGHVGPAREALAALANASCSHEWEWLDFYSGVFALLAACEGRAQDAARLLGYADRATQRVGIRGDAGAPPRTQALALIEAALDEATLARCMAQGARMDEASVCALALAEPPQRPH